MLFKLYSLQLHASNDLFHSRAKLSNCSNEGGVALLWRAALAWMVSGSRALETGVKVPRLAIQDVREGPWEGSRPVWAQRVIAAVRAGLGEEAHAPHAEAPRHKGQCKG